MFNILIGGIHIESSTFTMYRSSKKDFNILKGDDLINAYSFLDEYREMVNLLPIIHGRALPGGIVKKEFYKKFENEFFSLIDQYMENIKINGIFLDIHGAMSVEDREDIEGNLVYKLREKLGEDVCISVSMDLHGNISDKLFYSSDLISSYRTAPHIDQIKTKKRVFSNMIYMLKNPYKKIYKSKVDIPIILPGEKTSTEVEPARSIYELIGKISDDKDVLDLSLLMGFPWADEERCHGVSISYGIDKEKVKESSLKISQEFFNNRDNFKFVGPVSSIEDAIKEALNFKDKPFFISDTGDNPGAGSSGDINIILNKFIEANKKKKISKKILFASIRDKEAIDIIYDSNIGDIINLSLGSKIDLGLYGKPIDINVKIERKFFDETGKNSALVSLDNIYIIITEERNQYGNFTKFEKAGLESFDDFDIIVVKMGYLEPDLSKAKKGWIMALSPGPVNQDLKNIKYEKLNRPIYPLDNVNDYILKGKII